MRIVPSVPSVRPAPYVHFGDKSPTFDDAYDGDDGDGTSRLHDGCCD